MPRLSTTADAFNAIGDPQRRRILTLLSAGERPVNDLARILDLRQPQISKHLRVLREVRLVSARDAGQSRIYHLEAAGLKPVREWVVGFERFWNESFDKLAEHLADFHPQEQNHERPPRRSR